MISAFSPWVFKVSFAKRQMSLPSIIDAIIPQGLRGV